VLWGGGGGDEISFTILGDMNQNFGMEFFISAAVFFCRGAPWNAFCVLVKPGRLLCVSVTVMGCPQCGAGTCEMVKYSHRSVVRGSKNSRALLDCLYWYYSLICRGAGGCRRHGLYCLYRHHTVDTPSQLQTHREEDLA
jgi:hypothetical protein